MATRILTDYGPRTAELFFGDNESKYELWEVTFLGYLRIQLLQTDQNDDMDFVLKNATVFAELTQCLYDKLIISNETPKIMSKKH